MAYTFKEQKLKASDVVNSCMRDYILDVSEKKLPHFCDGLKAVHRRILWSMKNYDGFTDNDVIVSDAFKLHTSGDTSISSAMIRLSQPFSVGVNLVQLQGNRGSYSSKTAAADRYTKVKLSPIARDLFFNKVNNRTIPMKPDEKYHGYEPIHLIPRLPTSLLLFTLSLCVGIKSNVLPINITNLCDIVKHYIDFNRDSPITRTVDYSKIIEKFIPDFPIANTIRNKEQLVHSYLNHEYNTSVVLEGLMSVTNTDIVINTIPFGNEFESMVDTLRTELLKNKDHLFGEQVEFKNLTKDVDRANIVLTFKRNTDTIKMFEKYRKLLRCNVSASPLYNFTDNDGIVHNCPPPVLIHKWYEKRRDSVIGSIKYEQNQTSMGIVVNQTKLLLDEHYDEISRVIRDKSLEPIQIYHKLMDAYHLSGPQCKLLTESPIMNASRSSKESILAEIDRLKKKTISLASSLKSVDDEIYQDATYFSNTYGKKYPRKSNLGNYLGYIKTDSGILQFSTIDEACTYISNFPNSHCYMYKENTLDLKIPFSNGRYKFDGYVPTKISTHRFIMDRFDEDHHTLWWNPTEYKITYTSGRVQSAPDQLEQIPITRTFYGITNQGEIIKLTTDKLSKVYRKDAIQNNLIYGISNKVARKGVLVITINTSESNILRFNILDSESTRIDIPVIGQNVVLGYIPLGTSLGRIFNLPDFTVNGFKYLRIDNIKRFTGTKPIKELKLSKMSQRNELVSKMVEI